MVESSTASYSGATPSDVQSQGASTLKTKKSGSGQDVDKLYKNLNLRDADPELKTDDPLVSNFRKLLDIYQKIRVPSASAQDLLPSFQEVINLLRQNDPNDDLYDTFETFQTGFNAWKPAHKLFTLSNSDFDFDRIHSYKHNEFVLQRTVLTSILDRWRLNRMFTFNCEGHWKMAKHDPLPAPNGRSPSIGGLKADLVLFYRFKSFAGMKYGAVNAMPEELEKYAFPDGNTTRCFPLIFIEAKRGMQDLTYAIYCNMHNASQALWSMYKWMRAGKEEKTFFEHVRVLSISISAREMIVRLHRAECPVRGQDKAKVFV